MFKNKRIYIFIILALPLFLALASFVSLKAPTPASAYVSECQACHSQQVTAMTGGKHAALACEHCHEGAAAHLAAPGDLYPRVHFDEEICMGCHQNEYNTFEIASLGRTYYGGSDGSSRAPKGWLKTLDLPYWNVLIDGH